jgi:hypothetical protein
MVNDQLFSTVSRVRRSAAGADVRRWRNARQQHAARRRGRAHSGNPALLITTDLINLKARGAAGLFCADVVKPDVRSGSKTGITPIEAR